MKDWIKYDLSYELLSLSFVIVGLIARYPILGHLHIV